MNSAAIFARIERVSIFAWFRKKEKSLCKKMENN